MPLTQDMPEGSHARFSSLAESPGTFYGLQCLPTINSTIKPQSQRLDTIVARYVHRVGRTARMGRKGEAILFLLPAETGYLNLLEGAGHRVAAMDLFPVFEALPHTPTPSVRPYLEHTPCSVCRRIVGFLDLLRAKGASICLSMWSSVLLRLYIKF